MNTPRHIRIEAFTRTGRHEMIARLRDALQAGNADLIDYQMFSNTAINVNFEIVARNLERLRIALVSTGITFDEHSLEFLTADLNDDETVDGNLSLTFIHNEPDLRIPVPPIPG